MWQSTKSAEIALLVTDQFQRQWLGTELLRQLIQVGRDEHLQRLTGDILAENQGMQEMCKKLGFRLQYSFEDQVVKVELELWHAADALAGSQAQFILAGDEVAIPLLHRALSPQLEPLILEEVLRLDIRTPRHEVLREVAPILARVEEEESHARADRLVEAVREQGLGVIGLQETRDALEYGEGEVLAEEAALDEQERNDLVLLATLAGAEVDLVKGHEILQQMGGVGALLRYRPRWV